MRSIQFDGAHIRVVLDDVLVGANITVRRTVRRNIQDERVLEGISVANKAARSGVCNELKEHGIVMSAISKMVYGTWWTLPSEKVVSRARTVTINGRWGRKRAMRCPEIVVAVLSNPVRTDPAGAIIYKSLCDTRRMLNKSSDRYTLFRDTLSQLGILPNIQGPAHGFESLLANCGCTYTDTAEGIKVHNHLLKKSTDLLSGSAAAFRNFLLKAVQSHTLANLVARVHHIDENGKYGRKDMVGLTPLLDYHATFAASAKRQVKKFIARLPQLFTSEEEEVDPARAHSLWKRHIATILSGACRYADRLKAADIIDSDACKHPGCAGKRADAEHWIYECKFNSTAINSTGKDVEHFVEKVKSEHAKSGTAVHAFMRTM